MKNERESETCDHTSHSSGEGTASAEVLCARSDAPAEGVAKTQHERTEGLAARLRQTIESYGRVAAAAYAIGRSEGALRKWMRGRSEPNASDVRRLAELTGVSVEWLLFGMPAPSSRAMLMSYIAHSLYREVCQKAHLAEVRWGDLSPAEQGRYKHFAEGRVASWLAAASLPEESRSE